MASLNRVMLIGRAGRDAEMKYTPAGLATSTFSLAVDGWGKDAATEWFNCVLFGDTAERISQYITKGKQLFLEGRLQTRSWENDQGVKQYRTEVIAQNVTLLGGKDGKEQEPYDPSIAPRSRYPRSHGQPVESIDDLPFE